MEVGNRMKSFITLTKYNTCQQREEGNPQFVVNYLVSILPSLTMVSSVFMRIETYPLILILTVYNNPPLLDLLCTESISFPFQVNVDSLCIPSFHLTLSFMYFCIRGFPWGIGTSTVSKRTSIGSTATGVSFSTSICLLLFDSSAFCATFSVLWLNTLSYRFFWR